MDLVPRRTMREPLAVRFGCISAPLALSRNACILYWRRDVPKEVEQEISQKGTPGSLVQRSSDRAR